MLDSWEGSSVGAFVAAHAVERWSLGPWAGSCLCFLVARDRTEQLSSSMTFRRALLTMEPADWAKPIGKGDSRKPLLL